MQITDTQLLDKVRGTIAEMLQVDTDQITSDLAFGDIPQWDSMGHMEVMIALEEAFGVPVNAETISELVSVPLIHQYILEMGDE